MSERKTLFPALETWVEACRDLGRGALVEAAVDGAIDGETALDILDRMADNILGKVVAMKHREADDA